MFRFNAYLFTGAAMAVMASPALAQSSDYSNGIDFVEVQSNIPMINITVRNVANSTDPADRDLRVVSANPEFEISGRLECTMYGPGNYARAHSVRASFGTQLTLHATGEGIGVQDMLAFWKSDEQDFSDQYRSANVELDMEMALPQQKSGLVSFMWNPVDYVEDRLETYVGNGAGSDADFLRQDDVFNTQLTLNVVGECMRSIGNNTYLRAGFQTYPVAINIFYQGDEDIQDVIQPVSNADTVAAPTPNRARRPTTTRGAETAPPARTSRPARARTRQSDN